MGTFALDYSTGTTATLNYFSSTSYYQKCLGNFMSATKQLQIVFSRQTTAGVYSLFLGYVNNAFTAATTMTIWPIMTGSYNYIGTSARFTALNTFYISSYALGTSKYFS
jgi:hypothetical protein